VGQGAPLDATLSDQQPAPGRVQQEDAGAGSSNFAHALLDQAELASVNLSHASFNHANLAGADLTEANLSGAALDHADFLGANLANANLKSASLRFATLKEAKLDSADLSGADLRYARLNDADLTAANLSGSHLDYANFTGANLANTNLCGAHLRYAKNLTPAQLEQAQTDESTIRPFHYLELAPLSQTSRRTRRWSRPLMAASLLLLAGIVGVYTSVDLIRQRQAPHAAPAVVPPPDVTPLPASPRLALLTPSRLLPDSRIEVSTNARHIRPKSLAVVALYPTVLIRKTDAMTSETVPSGLQPVPVQRLRISNPTQSLSPSLPESVSAVDVPFERLALTTPAGGSVLSDAPLPVVAAVPANLTIPVREKAAKNKVPVPTFRLDPLTMVVSLSQQKIDIYRGTTRVTTSKISSGKRGHETKIGVFSILEKRRYHRSNLYSDAPMPWMQRLTWSGTALHAGVVPGYPASHGCIRLPFSFAPKLFQLTSVGENVVVTHARVTPKPIEHKTLFQPARSAPLVSMALADQDQTVTSDLAATDATLQGTEQVDIDAYDDAESATPLRMLITRRTPRDRIIGTQYVLASLGYLRRQNFTGRLGPETMAAIKAFQKANSLKVTGNFSEDVAKAIYRSAGKSDPPPGHLYVRQDFRQVFDFPVDFLNTKQSLGTHMFTAMKSPSGGANIAWMAISLEGDDSRRVLDRIEIPDDVRKQISERLTPGSTLIVADDSSHSAILREGDDFIVSSNEEPIEVVAEPRKPKAPAKVTKAKRRQAKPATVGSPRVQTRKAPPPRRSYRPAPHRGFWSFRRW